jgi:hypothetical protein
MAYDRRYSFEVSGEIGVGQQLLTRNNAFLVVQNFADVARPLYAQMLRHSGRVGKSPQRRFSGL